MLPATGDIQIEYSPTASTWEKVLHMVTFGYYAYKDNVTVTLHAQDRVSGVESFAWTYTQEENTSTTKNVALKNGVITQDQIAYSNNGKNGKGILCTHCNGGRTVSGKRSGDSDG